MADHPDIGKADHVPADSIGAQGHRDDCAITISSMNQRRTKLHGSACFRPRRRRMLRKLGHLRTREGAVAAVALTAATCFDLINFSAYFY